MKIFFVGSVLFSRILLEELLKIDNIDIVGIATKSKSTFNSDHSDLSDLAKNKNIPYEYIGDINNSETIKWINSLIPDVIFCFGWSSLIKKELLESCQLGVIGYHPSLLPKNRGRHPIIWALCLGLSQTGSTFFRMDEGADTGMILDQVSVDIDLLDDAKTLYTKLSSTACKQLLRFVPKLAEGKAKFTQQDFTNSNYWRKRSKNDGLIDFRMSSKTIYNLVRALTRPYVGSHFIYKNSDIKVWKAMIGPQIDKNIEPGKIIEIRPNNEILVSTANNTIWILEHELKEKLHVGEYLL